MMGKDKKSLGSEKTGKGRKITKRAAEKVARRVSRQEESRVNIDSMVLELRGEVKISRIGDRTQIEFPGRQFLSRIRVAGGVEADISIQRIAKGLVLRARHGLIPMSGRKETVLVFKHNGQGGAKAVAFGTNGRHVVSESEK